MQSDEILGGGRGLGIGCVDLIKTVVGKFWLQVGQIKAPVTDGRENSDHHDQIEAGLPAAWARHFNLFQ